MKGGGSEVAFDTPEACSLLPEEYTSGVDSCSTSNMDGNAIRQGVYITAVYVGIFYVCIVGQAAAKTSLQKSYHSRGERFERYYNVTDKAMLAWDRIVGNLLEQAMPFLTLFWVNVGLAAIRLTDYRRVAVAGWIYVVFRALYTAAWFAGGGGRGGARPKILLVTPVMYAVIIYLLSNMLWAVRSDGKLG